MPAPVPVPVPGPSAVATALATNRLGVPSVISFVMSGIAPLTVVAGVVTTAYAVTGLTGIPAAFLTVAVVLGVFSVGYTGMGRHVKNTGAFYAFVTGGLGRPAGVAAALVALAAYSGLQVGLYGAFGPGAADFAANHLGLHAPWWVWAAAACAAVAVLSLRRVELTGRVLGVLMGLEVLAILALSVAGLLHPADGPALAALNPFSLAGPGLGALVVIAVLGFVGFEGAVVLTEESRNARVTIPLATFTSLALIAFVYTLASWALAVFHGTGGVVAATRELGPGAFFALSGGVLSLAAQALYLTSLFAAMLTFQTYFARYAFSLGREHVLPGALARVNRHRSPWVASTAQVLISLAVIVGYALAGWDPLVRLFFWVGTTGGFGVLLLITTTSVAVLVFFRRSPSGESRWTRIGAPAVASVVLAAMVVAAWGNYATLLGVPPGAAEAVLLPASYLVVAAVGVVLALALRARRPGVYAGIGADPRRLHPGPPVPYRQPAGDPAHPWPAGGVAGDSPLSTVDPFWSEYEL